MNRFLLTLFLLWPLALNSAKPSGGTTSSPWVRFDWNSQGKYVPVNAYGVGSDVATFSLPQTARNAAYPSFLTTTKVGTVLGNLTGKTVSATVTVSVTGNPVFVYGGQGSWNNGGVPANARLFISISPDGYSNSGYTACPSCYWWSHGGVVTLSASTGTQTISDTF